MGKKISVFDIRDICQCDGCIAFQVHDSPGARAIPEEIVETNGVTISMR